MNLSPLLRQATHNQRNGWCWVLLRPALAIELCDRLEQIGPLAEQGLKEWTENHREELFDILCEIQFLATLDD